MVLHLQTIGRIFGTVTKSLARYNRYESKLFDSAYRGFPRGFGRGARHGYIAGSVLGSLINDDDGTGENGFPQQGAPPKARKLREAYRRYPRRFSRRYPDSCYPDRKRRQSSNFKSYGLRYR